MGYLTISLLGAGFGLWFALTWHPSGASPLADLYPCHSPLPSLVSAAVCTCALVALSQPALRQVSRITTCQMVQVVAAAVLFIIAIGVAR